MKFVLAMRCLALLCLVVATPALAAPEPVTLKPQPNTELDRIARTVVADELGKAAVNNDVPLVLVGEARLGGAKDRPALFIQLQSARECGSAGCDTSVYLNRKQAWAVVLDSVGGKVSVDSARHGGMRDLVVAGGGRFVWDGTRYQNTRPAAKVDLRPRR